MPNDSWRTADVMLDVVRGRAARIRRGRRRMRLGAAGASVLALLGVATLVVPRAGAARPDRIRAVDGVGRSTADAGASSTGPAVASTPGPATGGGVAPVPAARPRAISTTTTVIRPEVTTPTIAPDTVTRLVPAVTDSAHDEVGGNDGTTDLLWATIGYDQPADVMAFVTAVRDMADRPTGMEYEASFTWDGNSYAVITELLPNREPSVTVGGYACGGCTVVLDASGNRASARVPLGFLNDVIFRVSTQGSGLPGEQHAPSPAIGPGSTVTSVSWRAARIRPVGTSGSATDVPDDHDDAARPDPWAIPTL
ncbi:MAG TPA: hypothetical protein VFA94_08740 [Acidimicrobiales bacterium]|nr:hypothetical protein [Acidimicrobiales bacterium]